MILVATSWNRARKRGNASASDAWIERRQSPVDIHLSKVMIASQDYNKDCVK